MQLTPILETPKDNGTPEMKPPTLEAPGADRAIETAQSLDIEWVALTDLKPHPRNYREHPQDQIDHLVQSIKENGFYRNLVISRDGYLLAGHGTSIAARQAGRTHVPCLREAINHDHPRAIKILAADNEISHLAKVNDRALTELLKEVATFEETGLLGTGFDAQMLANLVFVTRPEDEIQSFDEAAAWVGMPDYTPLAEPIKMLVRFETEADRARFAALLGVTLTPATKSMWFPQRTQDDVASVRLDVEDA